MPQLTVEEQNLVDKVVRQNSQSPLEALRQINKARKKAKTQPLEHTAVYRYVRGATHLRGRSETRGRKRALSASDVRALQTTRRRLIKEANGDKRVTYKDIMENCDLESLPSQDVVEDALRAAGVRYRKPREKIYIDEQDAKTRDKVARKWVKYPRRFSRRKKYCNPLAGSLLTPKLNVAIVFGTSLFVCHLTTLVGTD